MALGATVILVGVGLYQWFQQATAIDTGQDEAGATLSKRERVALASDLVGQFFGALLGGKALKGISDSGIIPENWAAKADAWWRGAPESPAPAPVTETPAQGLSCFPAGTLVATEDGLRPIESIASGQRVWAYDLVASRWGLRHVLRTYSRPCKGRATTVTVAGEAIESTARHPYFVVRGEDLEGRPTLEHLASVPDGATTPGRWVDAMDLRVGDELLLRDGRIERIDDVRVYASYATVYNFEVEELRCYAVGWSGVLVHNNNGSEVDAPQNPSRGVPDPSTPVGRRGSPLGSVQGNAPTTIGGRQYSGHAIDQMQARGVPPSVVENTIQHGVPGRPQPVGSGTTSHFDPVNNITVITDTASGRVVTVFPGR